MGLAAGQHDVVVEFWDAGGLDSVFVSWSQGDALAPSGAAPQQRAASLPPQPPSPAASCANSAVAEGASVDYLWDKALALPVVLEDGARKYVWGNGLAYAVDAAGKAEVYYVDGLGSVRAIADASAEVVQTYRTDEFGVPVQTQGSSTQPFQYTGEHQDEETGFIYLRARMYDPSPIRKTNSGTRCSRRHLRSPRSSSL